jgi:hypothetical protein
VNRKGQYSIIAALLVSAILITTFIVTYSMIRDNIATDQPQTLSAVDETNTAIKQILGFIAGYYGSVLEVTGNTTDAFSRTLSYAYDGLGQIANTHPEWGISAALIPPLEVGTYWYCNRSYSYARMAVSYNLTKLGVSGIIYQPTCKLDVQVNATSSKAYLNVTKDDTEPLANLRSNNFMFYNYTKDSAWDLVNPVTEPAYENGIYSIDVPPGIDPESYTIQVVDQRGIKAIASSFNQYTITPIWNSTFTKTQNATITVELLQNGTMRWLGENLQMAPGNRTLAIPPIPIRAFHLNQTISGVNQEVPFQIEDWASEYRVPQGLASNASLFNNRNMLVFLATQNVSKITIWWIGSDTSTQTACAYENRYFTMDDTENGILTNGQLALIFTGTHYRYVDSFDGSSTYWTEIGASPYLNDNSTNYISHNVNGQQEGWFGFQNLTGAQSVASGAIKSVKIDFECKRDGTDDYFEFRINDGMAEYGPYMINPPNSDYDWRNYDITVKVNSSVQINNLKLKVRYIMAGGSASTVYIRRCRIVLDLGGWLTSVSANATSKADFMNVNSKSPSYGANLAYIIHHGVIRDVIHQEAEWSSGISEYLWVDGFDGSYQQWSTSGSSPYLGDNDNYIYRNVNNYLMGWFSLQNMSSILDKANVKIQLECYCAGDGDDYFEFEINNGTHTLGPYSITGLPSSYGWKEYDLSDALDTWQEINNAKVRFRYKFKAGSTSNVYIRRCRLYVTTCPNVYSQIIITLPANATYYTYQLRLMFVESQWNRTISQLCPIRLTTPLVGIAQTENGTASGYPIVSNATQLFYNYSSSYWQHHWSQIVSGQKGVGIMFTDAVNRALYVFDGSPSGKTGGIRPNNATGTIELLPVSLTPVFFTEFRDVTWSGAVVASDGTSLICNEESGIKTGLWSCVEYPPMIALSTRE